MNEDNIDDNTLYYPISISFGQLDQESSDVVVIEITARYEAIVSMANDVHRKTIEMIDKYEEVDWQKEGF